MTQSGTIAIGTAGSVAANAAMTGPGVLTLTASAAKTFTLAASSSGFTGCVKVNSNITFAQNGDMGNGVVVVNGGIYTPDASSRQVGGFVFNSGTGNTANSITVNNYIGGTGTITAAMLGKLSGSYGVAPGDPTVANTIGALTVTPSSTYTLAGTSTFEVKASDFTHDQLTVTSGKDLAYGGTLKVVNLAGTLAVGNSWRLFSGTRNGTSTFANHSVFGTVGDGTNLPTLTGMIWAFDYASGTLSINPASGTVYSFR